MRKAWKNTLLGILAVGILGLSYWGFTFLKGQDIFNRNNEFFVVYEHIEGLGISSPVTVNGFKIGQVTEIRMLHGNYGKLAVSIETSREYPIPDSSVARIYSMDLMGTKGIEILLSDKPGRHESGDTLYSDVEQSLKEQVSMQMLPIKNKAEDLLEEMATAIEVVKSIFNKKTQENLTSSFNSIKKTVDNLENTSNNLDTLISEEKNNVKAIIEKTRSLVTNLEQNKETFNYLLNNLSDLSDTLLAADIAGTIIKADKAISDVTDVTERIKNGEGSLGMLINDDSLYNSLDNASKNMDRLIWDLRANPKRYFNLKLLDLGRTVNVVSEDQLNLKERRKLEKKRKRLQKQEEEQEDSGDIGFYIQIRSKKNMPGEDIEEMEKYHNLNIVFADGYYKYLLGTYPDSVDLENALTHIRKEFPDAFPLAIMDDQIISYHEGLQAMAE